MMFKRVFTRILLFVAAYEVVSLLHQFYLHQQLETSWDDGVSDNEIVYASNKYDSNVPRQQSSSAKAKRRPDVPAPLVVQTTHEFVERVCALVQPVRARLRGVPEEAGAELGDDGAQDPDPVNVFEIGMGGGRVLEAVDECFIPRFTLFGGMDVDALKVSHARRRFGTQRAVDRDPGRSFIVGGLTRYEDYVLQLSEVYDLVIAHGFPGMDVDTMQRTVSESYRLLKHGGAFVFMDLNAAQFPADTLMAVLELLGAHRGAATVQQDCLFPQNEPEHKYNLWAMKPTTSTSDAPPPHLRHLNTSNYIDCIPDYCCIKQNNAR